MSEAKKGWLIKYALTTGIEIVECTSPEDKSLAGRYVKVAGQGWAPSGFFTIGRDVVFSRAAAISKVEAMRQKKVDSLRKQIEKLESMKIDAPE